MQNAFDGLHSNLDMTPEITSELEDLSTEISKTNGKKKNVGSEYTITIDNYKMCNMYIGTTTRRGEKKKGRERVRKGGRDERKE